MSKVKYQIAPPDDPEYVGAPDTTFAGSRNGFSPIILWDFLARNSYQKQIERILRCEKLAAYAEDELKKIEERKIHGDINLYVERTDFSLTVRFRKPSDKIIFKYSLSCETLTIDGRDRHYAHLFTMSSRTRDIIDQLIADLSKPDAFGEADKEDKKGMNPLSTIRSRSFR